MLHFHCTFHTWPSNQSMSFLCFCCFTNNPPPTFNHIPDTKVVVAVLVNRTFGYQIRWRDCFCRFSTGSNLTSLIPFKIQYVTVSWVWTRRGCFFLCCWSRLGSQSPCGHCRITFFLGLITKWSPDCYNQNSAPNKTSETTEDSGVWPAASPSLLWTGWENQTTTVLSWIMRRHPSLGLLFRVSLFKLLCKS